MLEEDRVAVCGPRHAYQPERRAYRALVASVDEIVANLVGR